MTSLTELPGLGPKCEQWLKAININTAEDLINMGAIQAYLRLIETETAPEHLSLLYALVGAVEKRSWLDVARNDRENLIMQLDGMRQLHKLQK